MKMFLAALTLVSATSAFAAVKVGDVTVLNATVESKGGATAKGTVTATVTAVDEGKDLVAFTQTSDFGNGNVQTSDGALKLSAQLNLDKALVADLKGSCARAQGSVETIAVPAGSYEACKLTAPNSEGTTAFVWIAANAGLFNVVKQEQTNANTVITLELTSFTK